MGRPSRCCSVPDKNGRVLVLKDALGTKSSQIFSVTVPPPPPSRSFCIIFPIAFLFDEIFCLKNAQPKLNLHHISSYFIIIFQPWPIFLHFEFPSKNDPLWEFRGVSFGKGPFCSWRFGMEWISSLLMVQPGKSGMKTQNDYIIYNILYIIDYIVYTLYNIYYIIYNYNI